MHLITISQSLSASNYTTRPKMENVRSKCVINFFKSPPPHANCSNYLYRDWGIFARSLGQHDLGEDVTARRKFLYEKKPLIWIIELFFFHYLSLLGYWGPPKSGGGQTRPGLIQNLTIYTPGTMDSGQLDVTIENCQLSWFGLVNVLTYTLLGMVGPWN